MQQNATEAEASSLTPNQLKAIEALMRGASISGAAAAAGVDRTTVHRWLRDDVEFLAAYNAARRDLADGIQGELRGLAGDAVRTIRKVMRSPKSPAAVRLKAALTVLETMGGMVTESIGPTDADAIRDQRAQAERDWERWSRIVEDAMPTRLVRPDWTPAKDRENRDLDGCG
jgi:hypothetical protein